MSTSIAPVTNNGTDSSSNQKSGLGEGYNSLGQDAFMKLLVTQLQHQDPLKPKEDTEFIAQLAQFSSLEKLTTMNQNIETMLILIAQSMQPKADTGDTNTDNSTTPTGTDSSNGGN